MYSKHQLVLHAATVFVGTCIVAASPGSGVLQQHCTSRGTCHQEAQQLCPRAACQQPTSCCYYACLCCVTLTHHLP
jgi:hypothetical protein